LNKFIAQSCYVFDGEQDELSDAYICATDGGMPQIPATDAFLAEIRAEARNEGINYTASRLAAAFNHGFINKSLREVFDVTRMILSAKEELANESHPIDGLSGEYAEKSLEEWAERLRKGGNQ
ncbi:ead/Ea22-like family protein, partial [Escherichia coli]|nr:ead/Ea22-like family protein [Escherichia coli]EFB4944969.1 ead/Ea22-like family protein [Escherichia coli]EFL0009222.1 ead/Ea22-like family protein [Escherichia coli]MBF5538341.1 ead/Ea22-like family protein [Escherichia coli]